MVRVKGSDELPALRDNFIVRDNMTALESEVFNPITLARLPESISRITCCVGPFDRTLFDGKTYGDLYRRHGAPLVILNATDIATGEVFSFLPSRSTISARTFRASRWPGRSLPRRLSRWR